jgi:LysM repeat protein
MKKSETIRFIVGFAVLFTLQGWFYSSIAQVGSPGQLDNKTITETDKYINTYKYVAIKEMQRARIPASITMAQAILESSVGNSYIAKMGNNHFGIKCGSSWNGETVYYDDDQENECFRGYKSVDESFIDHSNFLTSSPRYVSLFKLEITDYRSWANGLKEAGYATRPNYAELLIGLIERYQLFEYDKFQVKVNTNEQVDEFVFNGLPAVMMRDGETYQSIADKHKIKLDKLLKYNELDPKSPIVPNKILYLKSKKSKGKDSYHIVKEGETMQSIAQDYGIKSLNLHQLNLMMKGDIPAVGEIIYLNKKRMDPPNLRAPEEPVSQNTKVANQDEVIEPTVDTNLLNENKIGKKDISFFKDDTDPGEADTSGNDTSTVNKDFLYTVNKYQAPQPATTGSNLNANVVVVNTNPPPVQPFPSPDQSKTVAANQGTTYHTVEKSQTLFSISKMYGMTVTQLQQLNNKSDFNLEIGQKLLVNKNNGAVQANVNTIVTSPPVVQPNTPPVTATATNDYHIVQMKETMFSISKMYGMTVTELQQLNNKQDNSLAIGQKLLVRKTGVRPTITIVKEQGSQTTTAIMQGKVTGNVVTNQPKVNPPVNPLPVKSSTAVPAVSNLTTGQQGSSDTVYHTVKEGETFYSISRDSKVKISDIIAWNNITEYKLSVGQKIIVKAPPSKNIYISPNPLMFNPTSDKDFHFVEQGQTLFFIARLYGSTPEQLRLLNNLQNNDIKVGMKLKVR